MHTCMYMYVYVHMYVHMYVHVHVYVCMYVCMYLPYTYSVCTCMYECVYTSMYVFTMYVLEPARRLSGELMKIPKVGVFVNWNQLFHRLTDHKAYHLVCPQTHKTQRVI